jgi:adenylate kinase family enzyme
VIAARAPIEALAGYAAAVLHAAIERATERRGRAFDPVRSLYVSDLEAFDVLASGARAEPLAPLDPPRGALPAALDGFSPFERATVAFLGGLSIIPRVERIVGFLHDDLTRSSITSSLLLDLFAQGLAERARALAAAGPDGLLARLSIVRLCGDDASHRSIELDPGMFRRLCGSDEPDRRIAANGSFRRFERSPAACELHPSLMQPMVLWGAGEDALAAAAAECAAYHARPLIRLSADAPPELYGLAAREALLDGALLSIATSSPAQALDAARALRGVPITAVIEAPAGILSVDGFAHHRIDEPLRPAAEASVAQPLPYGRRIVARRGLDRLVLPPSKVRALRSISARVEHRETVTGQWGLSNGSSSGGVRCLFSGPPGTGKTLAAEAIAAALGRDLYVVDVSTVVSKYIGETEKILAKVFAEAARAHVCLFFDEADALFGKRGEQNDAHDKYANVETAYLLQAIDAYPDLVVLATNLKNNLDDALSRRIDVFVDFPMPDAAARRTLWTLALAAAPHEPADLDRVAERFVLSGGAIQSAALTAAYEAAAESRSILLLDLMRSARDQFAKSGRVAGRVELGDHYDALAGDS